jgi:hypothetical protein
MEMGGGVIRRVIRVIEPITLQNPKNPFWNILSLEPPGLFSILKELSNAVSWVYSPSVVMEMDGGGGLLGGLLKKVHGVAHNPNNPNNPPP